jgi:3-deoxy-D-manno-octulosonate 8-phosphate phosphatase (KDO 8-P phosphatase)
MKQHKLCPPAATLSQLQAIILDCDGVLTPGDLFYALDGGRLLRFSARDGFGLAMLCRTVVAVGVLSGRPVDIAQARLQELGVRSFVGQVRDKALGLQQMCAELGVEPQHTAFVGDDLPDLAAFSVAGLRIAVGDAAPEVQAAAHWITQAVGGRGAVREVCEAILKARGAWQQYIDQALRPSA